MPVFMKYDGIDGRFNADSFDFSQVTTEATTDAVARTNKPSLVVKFDIGGPVADIDEADHSGTHALYQDVFIPAAQTDGGLLLPAVQADDGLLLPY